MKKHIFLLVIVAFVAACASPTATPVPPTLTPVPALTPVPTETLAPTATPTSEPRTFIEGVYCRKMSEEGFFDFLRFFPDGLVMNISFGSFADCGSAWDEAKLRLVPERVNENIHGEYFLIGDHIEFGVGVGGDEIMVDWIGIYRDDTMILSSKSRVTGYHEENLEYVRLDVDN